MDTMEQALKDGEQLLEELKRREREREERRRNYEAITIKDGRGWRSVIVPRRRS